MLITYISLLSLNHYFLGKKKVHGCVGEKTTDLRNRNSLVCSGTVLSLTGVFSLQSMITDKCRTR